MGVCSDLKRHQALKPQKNMVVECNQSKDVYVEHIPVIINPSDVFTKEMKDNTHFRNIIYSMMVSLQSSMKYIYNVLSHIISAEKLLPYYSIRSKHIFPDSLELKSRFSEHIIPNILEIQLGLRKNV